MNRHRISQDSIFALCLSHVQLIEGTIQKNKINHKSLKIYKLSLSSKPNKIKHYVYISNAAGKYTCSPSNANPVSVNVHILNGKSNKFIWQKKSSNKLLMWVLYLTVGEHPAAIQKGTSIKLHYFILLVALLNLLTSIYNR